MVKISAFADEVSIGLEKQLEFLSANEIRYIELRFIDGINVLDVDRNDWLNVKNKLDSYHVKVSAIASPIGKSYITDSFENEFSRFKRAVEIANFFQTQFIRVFSYYPSPVERIEDFRDEVLQRFRMKSDYLKGSDILMVHENETNIYGHSAANCLDIVKTIDSPNLKLVYDPANFVWGESLTDNVERCFPLLKEYVVHVHIKDWVLGSKDIGAMPGEGDAQIELLLSELSKLGYNGFLSLEPHLNKAGQFGGTTTASQFTNALSNLKRFCEKYELL
ncbi:xylose isomerase [Bacteroidia bacterium]|nr:xylose isomerase [Bacteroidia bacterium]